jgi:hypothetical protein
MRTIFTVPPGVTFNFINIDSFEKLMQKETCNVHYKPQSTYI